MKILRMYIEITNTCNMSCSFCIKNKRKAKIMTPEEFKIVIRKIKPFTKHIYLHVLGEPLQHPNLEEILNIAEENNMQVNITTNGTLFKNKQDILLKCKVLRKVSISLHSIEENSINSNIEYLNNVANFANNAISNKVITELRLWNLGSDTTYNKNVVIPLFDILNINDQLRNTIKDTLDDKGDIKIKEYLFLGKSEQFTWPSLNNPLTNKATYCHGLKKQIAILSCGTVVPCCLDSNGDINLGNIFKQDLSEILTSEKSNNIIQGFKDRKPCEELCKRCSYATKF